MRRILPLLVSLVFAACAARKSEEPAPQAPAGPAPGPATPAATTPAQQQSYPAPPGNVVTESGEVVLTVEDAERELERARRELVGVVGDKNARSTKKAGEPEPLSRGDSACGNACRAFASLQRAANAVCRLTSEGDPRCVRARSVVKENEARVLACGCEPAKE